MKGMVTRSTGLWYEVLSGDRLIYTCRVKGKLKLAGYKETNPIAVGDHVLFDIESDGGVITEILTRKNHIVRQSIKKSSFSHVLAANVDQVILIATTKQPRTSLGFIDRFFVSAESFRIPQTLIFNKKDLLNAGIAIPNEVDDVIDKAKQLAEEIAKVNLNKAEILEIFAENLFNKIRVLNNTSSDRSRDYSLSLLILSIFINDMQIEKPIDDTYEENFKIVTASINNFYSSSINSFINSIKSKIYYLIVWSTELGFNNVGQIFKALTDQITQLNKEKNLTSEFINSFETQISDLTGKIIYSRNLNANNNNIDVSELPKGMYFISFKNEDFNYTQKLILE
jgi:hypothetical protein